MKALSSLLAFLMTFASLPAFAFPDGESASDRSSIPVSEAWPAIPSPLESPLGRLIAQNEPEAPNQERIREIDREIAALADERRLISLTGPIIVTSVGLGFLVGGGALALLAEAACEDAKDDPGKDCNENAKDDLVLGGAIMAGVGGLVAIIGGVTWSRRTSERGKIDRKQLELRDERRSLSQSLASLRLGTMSRRGHHYVTLGFDF